MAGLLHFQTRAALLKFERAAARGLAEDARDRKADLQDELRILLDSLRVFLDCKVDRAAIAEALAGLIDAISNADHKANTDIDSASQVFDDIDMTEAHALLAKLRADGCGG
jgi:hypothetical protein